MGRSQEHSFLALKQTRQSTSSECKGLDSDNGSEFINQILYKYCRRKGLESTKSRANRKNDNAYIEEENWTHIRNAFGCLRYNTYGELTIRNDLYRNDLSLYKNLFQSATKLHGKERIEGNVKRRYEAAKAPYQRLVPVLC